MVGVRTNVVTSIEVTEGDMHDSPQFVGLVKTTAKKFEVKEVSADKAYISHANLKAVADVGHQQNLPLDFLEQIPRKDYSRRFIAAGALACLMLLLYRIVLLRSWQ